MKKQYKMIEDFNPTDLIVRVNDFYIERGFSSEVRSHNEHVKFIITCMEDLVDMIKDDLIRPETINGFRGFKLTSIFNVMFFYKRKLISYRSLPIDNELLYILDKLPRYDYGSFDLDSFWDKYNS